MASNSAYEVLQDDVELQTSDGRPVDTKQRASFFNAIFETQLIARKRWLPWLLFLFSCMVFLTFSFIYATIDIERHGTDRKTFLLISWAIFLVPSILAAMLVFTPVPAWYVRFRRSVGDRRPAPSVVPIINTFGAVLCLVAVSVYLYAVAFSDYDDAKWKNELLYQSDLPVPSFAWVFWKNEFIVRNKTSDWQVQQSFEAPVPPCRIYDGRGNNRNCTSAMRWTKIGGYPAYMFDANLLSNDSKTLPSLRHSIWLNQYAAYNSTLDKNPNRMDYLSAWWDPKIDVDVAWECGLINTPEISVFGGTHVNLELTRIEDKRGVLQLPPGKDKRCKDARSALFPDQTKAYHHWSSTFNFVDQGNYTWCDIEKLGRRAQCASQVIFSYASQLVRVTRSTPGISKIEIWLNAGAVAGGVQFFFWFLAMLAAY